MIVYVTLSLSIVIALNCVFTTHIEDHVYMYVNTHAFQMFPFCVDSLRLYISVVCSYWAHIAALFTSDPMIHRHTVQWKAFILSTIAHIQL